MKLLKQIELFHNGGLVTIPILPVISGRKKIELEAIIPKYVRIEEDNLQADYKNLQQKLQDVNSQIEEMRAEESSYEDATLNVETPATESTNDADSLLANKRANVNYQIALSDMQNLQFAIMKGYVAVHKDNINKDFVKAMINYDRVYDDALKEKLQSDNESDFWMEQDILKLGEYGNSFREIIIGN
jgi:septum formation topological specificity factor MinE